MRKDGCVDRTRTVEPKPSDYSAFTHGLIELPGIAVSEEKIRAFCTPCDDLGPDNICTRVRKQDQTRYVDRLYCGWANVRGVNGKMTANGFIPDKVLPQKP